MGPDFEWADYVDAIQDQTTHGFDQRLKILDGARRLFETHGSLARMTTPVRKRIAGTTTKPEKKEDGFDWQYFGGMGPNGGFAATVINSPQKMSIALDLIPLKGKVTQDHFEAFVEKYIRAFDGPVSYGKLGTATRLLAMKRPDRFVAINSPNEKRVCARFQAAASTTDLRNYWERIVKPMQQPPWWRAPRPTDAFEIEMSNQLAIMPHPTPMPKLVSARARCVGALLVLALSGCSDTERFSFDGASNDFCVPNDYVVDGPIWLTSSVVQDDGGLAFRGCGQSYSGKCDLPLNVSGGTLGPLKHLRWHIWANIVPDSEPSRTALQAISSRTYRVIGDDSHPEYRILAIPSPRAGKTGVYYWRVSAEGEPRLEPSSELLAECDGVNDKQTPDAPEIAYQCTRAVPMKDAWVLYHFWNGRVNSTFVSELDKQVFAGVNGWRCKKARR